jgi:hypothetical protein
METLFLICFLFGAIFTALAVVIGHVHVSVPGVDAGHFGHLGPGHGGHLGPAGHAGAHGPHGPGAHHTPHALSTERVVAAGLPLFNVSSALAFLTWFGAAGYVLLRFAAWPLAGAVAGAVTAGGVGALLIALFLGKVLAGEREMDPRDYRLEGTLARVTVGIPADGAGEIVFTKAGTRRSEAARSLTGRPIPRDTEVVIIDYARGVARVQPWEELLASPKSEARSLNP